MRSFLYLAAATVLALAFGLYGCSRRTTSSTSDATPVATENVDGSHDHADHNHAVATWQSEENPKIKAALAGLLVSDKAFAEKQKICPVSGEALGSMGAPIEVDVNGQPVFICCEGCKDELLAKPDEFLAKLKK